MMDDENPILNHIKRAAAVLAGAFIGVIGVTLVVAITASARYGAPVQVKEPEGSPLSSPHLSAAAPEATKAKEFFHQRCAPCHGPRGRGDGVLAPYLSTAPRDLVKGPYWLRTTPSGTAPTRNDLRKVIERGIPGTSMPGFENFLGESDGETDGVDRMINLLIKRSKYLRKPGVAIEPPEQASGEDWEIQAGRTVYESLACSSCHGDSGLGDGAKAASLKDSRGQAAQVQDLSAPWNFRRGGETHQIWMTLEIGLDPTHMPDLQNKTSQGDRLALAAYLHSLSRKLLNSGDMKAAREKRGQVAHGRDMVAIMACQRCHTPLNNRGLPDLHRAFAGGTTVTTTSGSYLAGNLTPDPKTGLGQRSDAEIIAAITEGLTLDGREMDPDAMPWTWYSRLTQSDRASIVAYLRTLPTGEGPASGKQENGESTSTLSMMFGGGDPAVLLTSAAGGSTSDQPQKAADDVSDEPEFVDNEKPHGADADPPADDTVTAGDSETQSSTAVDSVQMAPQNIFEAKAHLKKANQRLREATADLARAKAQYDAFKGTKKKKRKKSKRRRRRRRR